MWVCVCEFIVVCISKLWWILCMWPSGFHVYTLNTPEKTQSFKEMRDSTVSVNMFKHSYFYLINVKSKNKTSTFSLYNKKYWGEMSFYNSTRNTHLTRAQMIYFPVLISFLVKIKWSDSIQALCPSSGCSSSTVCHPQLPFLTCPLPWLDRLPTIQTHCSPCPVCSLRWTQHYIFL